jgi:hypothetical protein
MSNKRVPKFLSLESRDPARNTEVDLASQTLGIPLAGDGDIQTGELRVVFQTGALELWDHTCVRRGMRIDFSDIDVRAATGNLSKKQPLGKAVGRETHHILDATAGFGHDAFLLACMGYRVTACERSPVVYTLLKDALDRAEKTPQLAQALGGRLTIQNTDSIHWLTEHKTTREAIYLDPMFDPAHYGSALPKKPAQLLRALIGPDEDAGVLLNKARAIAHRVVVKRSNSDPPLNHQPTHSIYGKTVRYDVYMKEDIRD